MQNFKEFFNNDIYQEITSLANWVKPPAINMSDIQKSAQILKIDFKALQDALKSPNTKLMDFSEIKGADGNTFWTTLKNPNIAKTSAQIVKDANAPKPGTFSITPIVLVKDGKITCIHGESKLFAAKAVNIKPKVLVVNM